MNPYFYWFFTVHHFYIKNDVSRTFKFNQISMFSVFVMFLCMSSFFIIDYSISDFRETSQGKGLWWAGGSLLILGVNYLIFLPKIKNEEFYEHYKKVRTSFKDFIFNFFSIFSCLLMFTIMILGNLYNRGYFEN